MIVQKPSREPNVAQKLQMERKYGMFIHFGINTFSENGLEWSDGTLATSIYSPEKIDAEQWARIAKEAGMKYIILVTKHHDGFCLFHTRYTNYGVLQSPNTTDVVYEVYQACEKYGLKLGLYYSLWDRHESCFEDDLAYVNYMKGQIRELLDGRYGEIVEFWFDGGWDKTSSRWHLDEIYDLIKSMQVNCVVGVNHTIGVYDSPGMATIEYNPCNYEENQTMKYFPSDFRLLDPHITKSGSADPKLYLHQGFQYYLPYEGTICIKKNGKWFWSPEYPNYPCVEPKEIARLYNHFVEQDNVFIVNCGPNRKGEIEAGDRDCLLEVVELV